MSSGISRLLAEIETTSSLDDAPASTRLEALVQMYFRQPEADRRIEVRFRLYERFPAHDAFGIFWSVLHGLEKQPSCAMKVVEWVRRAPSGFAVRMLSTLSHSGVRELAGTDLVEYMHHVSDHQRGPRSVRDQACEHVGAG